MAFDDCDSEDDDGPPSRNAVMHAAALEAGALYENQTGPQTIKACARQAAKNHKVAVAALQSYLMATGARTLRAIDAGAEPPETPNEKIARRVMDDFDANFLCSAYGEGCRKPRGANGPRRP